MAVSHLRPLVEHTRSAWPARHQRTHLFRRLAAGKLRRRTLEDGRVQVWLPLTADRQATVIPSETLSVGDRHVAEGYRQSSWSENETAPNGPSVDDRQVSDSDSQSDPDGPWPCWIASTWHSPVSSNR